MAAEILFVGTYDVKGGPWNKEAAYVCLSEAGCLFLPIHVARFHSQVEYLTIYLKCNKSPFSLKSSLEKLALGKAVLSLVQCRTSNKSDKGRAELRGPQGLGAAREALAACEHWRHLTVAHGEPAQAPEGALGAGGAARASRLLSAVTNPRDHLKEQWHSFGLFHHRVKQHSWHALHL